MISSGGNSFIQDDNFNDHTSQHGVTDTLTVLHATFTVLDSSTVNSDNLVDGLSSNVSSLMIALEITQHFIAFESRAIGSLFLKVGNL
jgi:hypothetical protein